MRPLLVLLGACGLPAEPPVDDTVPDGVASGVVPWRGETHELVAGVAYLDSPAHGERVVVRLTTWPVQGCERRGEGVALEVPADGSQDLLYGSWWRCEDDGCASYDHPLVERDLVSVGSGVGERIAGSWQVLDDRDQVVAEVSFDVPFCGR